mmetsp:Transcript_122123/g.353050  ORF Transcript_122123/g.353050 Transcript_122123/m.353050 type:complete len:295 (+) Transcript_122123:225-1109(+)
MWTCAGFGASTFWKVFRMSRSSSAAVRSVGKHSSLTRKYLLDSSALCSSSAARASASSMSAGSSGGSWSSTSFLFSSCRTTSSSQTSMASWPWMFCFSTWAPKAIMYSTTSVCRVRTASISTVVPWSSAAFTSAFACRIMVPIAVRPNRTARAKGVAPVASVCFTTTFAGGGADFHGCVDRRRIASWINASGVSPLNSMGRAATGFFFFATTPLAASLALVDGLILAFPGFGAVEPLESSRSAADFFAAFGDAPGISASDSPGSLGGACGGRSSAATASSCPWTTARPKAPRSP